MGLPLKTRGHKQDGDLMVSSCLKTSDWDGYFWLCPFTARLLLSVSTLSFLVWVIGQVKPLDLIRQCTVKNSVLLQLPGGVLCQMRLSSLSLSGEISTDCNNMMGLVKHTAWRGFNTQREDTKKRRKKIMESLLGLLGWVTAFCGLKHGGETLQWTCWVFLQAAKYVGTSANTQTQRPAARGSPQSVIYQHSIILEKYLCLENPVKYTNLLT